MAEQADPRADRVAFGRQVEPEHPAAATHDREQTGAEPQQRGLAGPVRTAQQHDLAGADRERGPGQGGKATEDGDRVVEFDHGAWVPVHGRRAQPYVMRHGPASVTLHSSR